MENSAYSGKIDDVLGSEMREDLMKLISNEQGWPSGEPFFTSKRMSRGMAGSRLKLFFGREPDSFA